MSKTQPIQNEPPVPAGATVLEPEWLGAVRQQVASLRFGVVQLSVHNGRVVQIERTEKIRFEPKPASAA